MSEHQANNSHASAQEEQEAQKRAEKVARLKRAVADGSYRVKSEELVFDILEAMFEHGD